MKEEELLKLNQKLYNIQKKSDSLAKLLWETSQAISDNNRDSFNEYCDSELREWTYLTDFINQQQSLEERITKLERKHD